MAIFTILLGCIFAFPLLLFLLIAEKTHPNKVEEKPAKTIDNSLSAHFEPTVAITKKGAIVLTK